MAKWNGTITLAVDGTYCRVLFAKNVFGYTRMTLKNAICQGQMRSLATLLLSQKRIAATWTRS